VVALIALPPLLYAFGIVIEELLKFLEVLAHIGRKLVLADVTSPAWVVSSLRGGSCWRVHHLDR
jgi:hypothetical protein